MSAQHTPGPWFANDHNTMAERMAVNAKDWLGYAWVGFGGNADGSFQGKLACLDRRRDGHGPFRERAAADARLIAAAPELLAALENLADFCEQVFVKPKENEELIHALSVIAKARGAA